MCANRVGVCHGSRGAGSGVAGAKSARVTRGCAIRYQRAATRVQELMWGWRGGGRQWQAGSVAGAAHLHGVADDARRSIPAQCMGPASTRVCVRRAAKGAQGNLARRAPGIGQQVHAAGLGGRRAAGARCVVGRTGSTPARAARDLANLRAQRTL